MTREERELSIEYLEGIKDNYIEGYGYERHPLPEYYAIENAIKALQQKPCENCISRQAVLDLAITIKTDDYSGNEIMEVISVDDVKSLPPVHPKYNTSEWCHDCKEYDRDKHCCPRYNGVIRKAVEEIKQSKTGHWIYEKRKRLINETDEGAEYVTDYWCKCSKCGGDFGYRKMKDAFCKYCGARMIELQESEES